MASPRLHNNRLLRPGASDGELSGKAHPGPCRRSGIRYAAKLDRMKGYI